MGTICHISGDVRVWYSYYKQIKLFFYERKKHIVKHIIGETRVRRGFLFLPMSIYEEQRWLEMAEWEERMSSGFNWIPTRWLN